MALNKDFFKDKKALITGGAGFIGSSLAHALVDLGAEVTVLDAMLPLYGGNLFNLEGIRDKIKFVEGDIRDKELVNDLVKGQDFIFDLAAQVSYIDSKELPFLDLDINGVGHMNVLEAARLYAPNSTYVFTSSRLVYGKLITNPVSEDHPTNPLSLYGVHKLLDEKYCSYYFKTFGLKTIVARVSNPYGPRQQVKHNKYSIPGWFMRQALDNQTIKIFGDGKQNRDYIYIDDVVSALLVLGEKGRGGEIYNIGTKEEVKFIDMVDAVINAVGSGKKEHIPWPEYYEKNETGDYFADISKIERETDWEAKTNLKDGINEMVKFYKQNLNDYWLGDGFSVELAVRDYLDKRFSDTDKSEKDLRLKKWLKKLKFGSGLVNDIEAIAGSLNGKKVLDAGSGLGIVSVSFAKKGANVIGIENDKTLVGLSQYIAQANNQNINFIYSSLDQLPFPENSFDITVSINTINKMESPKSYLEELTRVLKNSGLIYISFPMNDKDSYSYSNLLKDLKNMSTKYGSLELNTGDKFQSGFKGFIKKIISKLGFSHHLFASRVILTLIKK